MNHLKLLLPVDFTDQSTFAIHYAKNLKERFDIEIVLLHVLEVSAFTDINSEGHFEDMMGVSTEMLEIQKNAARDKIMALKAECDRDFANCSSYIKIGPLTETIVSFAEKMKADIILMGTKGADGLKAWISGSETQIVARRSEIPVLSVMCDRSDTTVKHILFISDFGDLEVAPDQAVMLLAEGFQARIHLLCIAKPGTNREEKYKHMEEYAGIHHLKNFELHIIEDKKVVDGINHFDQMEEMDMIVLGTHGRKGISHLLFGSIAEKLINNLYKPVLVYKI